jgi:hypothetical protein
MMDVILNTKTMNNNTSNLVNNSNPVKKQTNGYHLSNNSIPSTVGGLPGVRARTRQSVSQDKTNTSTPTKLTTDTEEDENGSFDLLIKSTFSMPKGQPPKKRTKKYGDRKSCKFDVCVSFCKMCNLIFFPNF